VHIACAVYMASDAAVLVWGNKMPLLCFGTEETVANYI
jgi:hypothetical protein